MQRRYFQKHKFDSAQWLKSKTEYERTEKNQFWIKIQSLLKTQKLTQKQPILSQQETDPINVNAHQNTAAFEQQNSKAVKVEKHYSYIDLEP